MAKKTTQEDLDAALARMEEATTRATAHADEMVSKSLEVGERLTKATQQAEQIIDSAHAQAEAEATRIIDEARAKVADMTVEAQDNAGKILQAARDAVGAGNSAPAPVPMRAKRGTAVARQPPKSMIEEGERMAESQAIEREKLGLPPLPKVDMAPRTVAKGNQRHVRVQEARRDAAQVARESSAE